MDSWLELLGYDERAPLLFTSGQFLFWFGVFYLGFLLVAEHRVARIRYLTLASWFFYYKCGGIYVFALLATTLLEWYIALRVARSTEPVRRKRWVMLSIAANGGALIYFKYTNFLLGSWAALLEHEFSPLAIVLPVGISFYTFQSLSYVVDVYRGRLEPSRSPWEYACYLAFFPQIVAGPIVRACDLLRELRAEPSLDRQRLGSGLFLILCGVVQKAVLADYLARFTDQVAGGAVGLSGLEVLLGVYGYALQILCDFAGYSLIALGLGRLMGVELPENFRTPYAATSVTDFWRRWHITLSSWLRDYVYVPLGGNRRGRFRTYLNLLLTMAFGGLWHGAGASFLFWGVGHGLLLAGERAGAPFLERVRQTRAGRLVAWFVTFHIVVLLWLPFRTASLSQSAELVMRVFTDFELATLPSVLENRRGFLLVLVVAAAFGLVSRERLDAVSAAFARSPIWLRATLALAVAQLTLEVASSEVQPFIYFQF